MSKKILILLLVILVVGAGFFAFFISISNPTQPTSLDNQAPAISNHGEDEAIIANNADTKDEPYMGQDTKVAGAFTIKVPGGWRASVSTNASFLGIQFARPSQLESLIYDKNKVPSVDYNGIPAWNGLTEHFYIRALTSSSQYFNPAAHTEVSTESFIFDDGTVGQKYSVSKHSTEAKKWGGLLKDDVWYGRVYVYEKDGKHVEAHLAYYPSTKIDANFYEKVASTIR